MTKLVDRYTFPFFLHLGVHSDTYSFVFMMTLLAGIFLPFWIWFLVMPGVLSACLCAGLVVIQYLWYRIIKGSMDRFFASLRHERDRLRREDSPDNGGN